MAGLRNFVVEQYDEATWQTLLQESGIGSQLYIPASDYPDEHVLALLETAVELTGIEQSDLLYEFGRFLVPPLVKTYGVHVDGTWTATELIANVEEYIHEALRARNFATFTPPALSSERIDDETIVVRYGSPRALCHLAEGLLDGIAAFYGTSFEVTQRQCMHAGDERCEFLVREVAAEVGTETPKPVSG